MRRLPTLLASLCLLLPLFTGVALAQEYYLYQGEQRETLHPKNGMWVVLIPDSVRFDRTALFAGGGVTEKAVYEQEDKAVVRLSDASESEIEAIRARVGGPMYSSPVFDLGSGEEKYATDEILVQWKEDVSEEQVRRIRSDTTSAALKESARAGLASLRCTSSVRRTGSALSRSPTSCMRAGWWSPWGRTLPMHSNGYLSARNPTTRCTTSNGTCRRFKRTPHGT